MFLDENDDTTVASEPTEETTATETAEETSHEEAPAAEEAAV